MSGMKESQGMAADRHALAEQAGESAAATEVLSIQCARSHHLGRVVQTPSGLVVQTQLHRRSHGRADLHSDPHGVDEPSLWWDLLAPIDDPAPDDAIPAGCACGDYLLSREQITEWLAGSSPRVLLD